MLNYCSPIFLHVLLLSFNASIWRFFMLPLVYLFVVKKQGFFTNMITNGFMVFFMNIRSGLQETDTFNIPFRGFSSFIF